MKSVSFSRFFRTAALLLAVLALLSPLCPAVCAADAEEDEDGDGILVEQILGADYRGYLMTVLDPSRVILACVPENFGRRSMSVEEYVSLFGGVAGVNAGGFYDPDGQGDGSLPVGLVVFEGESYYGRYGLRRGFAGLDGEHRLVVDLTHASQAEEADIRYGASFGPALICGGEIVEPEELSDLGSIMGELHPRMAIAQREDGAILFLFIEGRQVSSMGCTCLELADILLAHGAVNACNLDGGRSAAMWYNGGYLRSPAAPPARNVPNAFVVLPAEDAAQGSSSRAEQRFPVWSPEDAELAFPEDGAEPDGDERARLEAFAEDFTEKYVGFMGAPADTARFRYYDFRPCALPGSELSLHIRAAYGGQFRTYNGRNTLQSFSVEELRQTGEASWLCAIRFTVLSRARGDEVESAFAARLRIVEQDGALYAEAMQFR